MTSAADHEKRMRDLGRERYRSKVRKAREQGRETTTVAGIYLLKEAVARVGEALDAWVAKAPTGPGKRHAVLRYVKLLPTDVIALIAVKLVLDNLAASRGYLSTAINISSRIEDEARFRAVHDAVPGPARQIFKRYFDTGYKNLRREVVEALKVHKVDFEPWPRKIKVRLGMLLMEILRKETGLIIVQTRTDERGKTVTYVEPDPVSLEWLEKSHAEHELLFPFFLPTTVPPVDWEDLDDGGYHTNVVYRKPLVKTQNAEGRLVLSRAAMPEVYTAVNTLQRVAWEVNPEVYETMKALWESAAEVADLAPRSDERPPPYPEELAKESEEARAWRKNARLIHEKNKAARSHRLMTAKILFMAREFLGQTFYYPQTLDFRGRIYPRPYFLQPQGPSQARGLLRFSQGKPLQTAEAIDWWRIHGANCYGIDKVPFWQRIEWVVDSEREILSCGRDPLDNLWWAQAEKPWEFLAFCIEYADRSRSPDRFISKIPIQMDGSNNGLQIFSLLLRDEVGGLATNCVPTERPQDIYQQVADKVTEYLEARRDKEQFAREWLGFFVGGRVPRGVTKRPVMVLPYGGTRYSCHHYVMDWFLEERKRRPSPWRVDYFTPCHWLSTRIWEAIHEVVVAARKCMEWLQAIAGVCHKQRQPLVWTTPTGFAVNQAYTKYDMERIETSYGDSVRKIRARWSGYNLCSRKQRNGVSPNFVHSLDAAALVRTVNLCLERGVENFLMIHDSFGTTAADAPLLAEMLRRAYVEIFSVDLLQDLKEQLEEYLPDPSALPELPPQGSLDVGQLTSSLYFFA